MEHLGTKVLETNRLILRPFCQDDCKAVYENWASDDEVTRYLSWHTHTDQEQTRAWLASRESQYADLRYYSWCIVLKATGEAVGDISCIQIDEEIGAAELGWVLSRRYWGQSIMPEAGRRVIDFLLDEVGFRRVWARHDAQNPKSGRAMIKCGMRYEGTHRQAALNKDGQLIDIVIYSILRSDARRKDALIE